MAPIKGGRSAPSKGGKGGSSSSSKSGPSKSGPSSSKSKSSGPSSKGRTHSSVVKANATQQKPKSISHGPQKKKRRIYTEKELNIPSLNGIRPTGVQKPQGVKKGKNFVDDKESMMAILAMVQAEKEGNIESKMIRARQMEEIREARRAEQEKKEAGRKQKLEETKDDIRKRKKNKGRVSEGDVEKEPSADKPKKKRVSFG